MLTNLQNLESVTVPSNLNIELHTNDYIIDVEDVKRVKELPELGIDVDFDDLLIKVVPSNPTTIVYQVVDVYDGEHTTEYEILFTSAFREKAVEYCNLVAALNADEFGDHKYTVEPLEVY